MERGTWVQLGFWASIGTLLYAFYIQNSLRLSSLSLDLGFGAWKLAEPQPLPLLLLAAFAIGLLPISLWSWWKIAVLRGQIRKLQQELAMTSDLKKDGWK